MSDLPPDESVPDETPPEVVPPVELPSTDEPAPAPPTLADLLALLGLPPDARALVVTPETVVAIAADYPEPYTPPTEEP
ncbi:hypothetical protein [Sanguibacter massiliensis]|uniref:hypothetical protein n=1 Tax=Sanguibacter massiliensis TaxID=1973217 RepID=UPI000C82DE97|nr:hypothetical protein [Sanguibacter massiliensis]